MSKWITSHMATVIIIAVWILLFLLQGICAQTLEGRGINEIHGQYYRCITASFVHRNFIHLIANVLALFWVGEFLEREIGSFQFLFFGLIAATIAQTIFLFIYKNAESSFGGSPVIFALIGLIVALQIAKPEFPRLRLGTWSGNWIIAYAIVGNIPVLTFMNLSTVVIHLLAFVIGAAAGLFGILIL